MTNPAEPLPAFVFVGSGLYLATSAITAAEWLLVSDAAGRRTPFLFITLVGGKGYRLPEPAGRRLEDLLRKYAVNLEA